MSIAQFAKWKIRRKFWSTPLSKLPSPYFFTGRKLRPTGIGIKAIGSNLYRQTDGQTDRRTKIACWARASFDTPATPGKNIEVHLATSDIIRRFVRILNLVSDVTSLHETKCTVLLIKTMEPGVSRSMTVTPMCIKMHVTSCNGSSDFDYCGRKTKIDIIVFKFATPGPSI